MLSLFALCVAPATTVADWDLEAVLARADSVVIATVGARRATGDGYFESRLVVERVLFGRGAPLVVSQIGDGDLHRVVGDIDLETGGRYLLATEERGGRRFIVGLVLGAWEVRGRTLLQDVRVLLVRPGSGAFVPGRRSLSLADLEAALARRRSP